MQKHHPAQGEISMSFTDEENADMKYLVPNNMPNSDKDQHLYNYFGVAGKNIWKWPYADGQTLKVSLKSKQDDFMTSNGWLDSFVSWDKIKMVTSHGDSAHTCPKVLHNAWASCWQSVKGILLEY